MIVDVFVVFIFTQNKVVNEMDLEDSLVENRSAEGWPEEEWEGVHSEEEDR